MLENIWQCKIIGDGRPVAHDVLRFDERRKRRATPCWLTAPPMPVSG